MELKKLPLNDQQMFPKRFIRNVTKKMNFEKMLIKANKFSKPTIAIRFILKEYALEEKLERKQGRSVLPPGNF